MWESIVGYVLGLMPGLLPVIGKLVLDYIAAAGAREARLELDLDQTRAALRAERHMHEATLNAPRDVNEAAKRLERGDA